MVNEAIAAWGQKRGPCVGDFCVLKNGDRHRIAAITNEGIKLADFRAVFILEPDSDVSYARGGVLNHPPIPKSALKMQPERERGAAQLRLDSSHISLSCRVFKEI